MQVTKLNITVPFEQKAWDDLENQIIKQNQDFSWTAKQTIVYTFGALVEKPVFVLRSAKDD